MILEEYNAEDNQDIVVEWYSDYSFYIMKWSIENEFLWGMFQIMV